MGLEDEGDGEVIIEYLHGLSFGMRTFWRWMVEGR